MKALEASNLAPADRLATRRLTGFDQRHFRVVEPLSGGASTLLAADR